MSIFESGDRCITRTHCKASDEANVSFWKPNEGEIMKLEQYTNSNQIPLKNIFKSQFLSSQTWVYFKEEMFAGWNDINFKCLIHI
jgi:hypothetical protein